MPGKLNWWIGLIFALGASLFALASLLSLLPGLAKALSLESVPPGMFFAGSIPFSIAAYLQLYQAANAHVDRKRTTPILFGWQPHRVGWLASALQFIGTLLFNVNTLSALIDPSGWIVQELIIWSPNVLGSILFLVSGYLAFIEACHRHWAFRPRDISWWVVFINLLGCVCFMLSAVFGVILPQPLAGWESASLGFTFAGAVLFLFGSLLLWPEAAP